MIVRFGYNGKVFNQIYRDLTEALEKLEHIRPAGGFEEMLVDKEEMPKKVVTKEAREVVVGGALLNTDKTKLFHIPYNAKNIRCLYDVEEDQHIELDTRRGKL